MMPLGGALAALRPRFGSAAASPPDCALAHDAAKARQVLSAHVTGRVEHAR
jgi:hypothetical protein